jgi:signal transduction histidine kinase
MVIVILIVMLAVAFGLSNSLQRPISDPILSLAGTMKAVSEQKNYAIRVLNKSSDEIGQLYDGFNNMLAQIQKRDADLELYAAELLESNEELKAFLYSAAHDLREPLVNIKGFIGELGFALKEINSVVSEESLLSLGDGNRTRFLNAFMKDVPEALGFIDSAVDRMDSLISSLLGLSRVGHRVLKFETIAVSTLVNEVVNSLQQQIREKNVHVVVGVLPDMKADREAMEQIFANLIGNAIKYLAADRPGLVEISGEQNGAEATFRVRDNGRGISRDDMPKLFKMFRRLGKQDVTGEGVGLAFVKTLVRRHGGRIWCESEPDVGSTFGFSIPNDRNAVPRGEQP